jgi:hypothetical protein
MELFFWILEWTGQILLAVTAVAILLILRFFYYEDHKK